MCDKQDIIFSNIDECFIEEIRESILSSEVLTEHYDKSSSYTLNVSLDILSNEQQKELDELSEILNINKYLLFIYIIKTGIRKIAKVFKETKDKPLETNIINFTKHWVNKW